MRMDEAEGIRTGEAVCGRVGADLPSGFVTIPVTTEGLADDWRRTESEASPVSKATSSRGRKMPCLSSHEKYCLPPTVPLFFPYGIKAQQRGKRKERKERKGK